MVPKKITRFSKMILIIPKNLYDSLLNSTVINNIVVPVNSHAYYNEYGRCKEAVYDRVFEMSLVILSYITMRSLLIDICKYRRTYEKSYN